MASRASLARLRRARRSPNDVRILCGVGGTSQPLMRNDRWRHLGFDYALFVDVPVETHKVFQKNPSCSVKVFELAAGETVDTLVRHPSCPPPAALALRARPGISVQAGLGRKPVLAHVAAQALIERPHFQRWLKEEFLDRISSSTTSSSKR